MPNIYRVNYPENEDRGGNLPPPDKKKKVNGNKKSKTDFKTMKNNTVKSLNEVEYFLGNFGDLIKYAKFFKYFKK